MNTLKNTIQLKRDIESFAKAIIDEKQQIINDHIQPPYDFKSFYTNDDLRNAHLMIKAIWSNDVLTFILRGLYRCDYMTISIADQTAESIIFTVNCLMEYAYRVMTI